MLLGTALPLAAEALFDNEYFARTWQAEDGLPENRVVGVVQAPDGFLWVSTQGAVLRFDGVRFQRVSVASSPNLIAGTMRGLLLDRFGRIWVAKEEDDTLFCFEGATIRIFTSEQGLPKNDRQFSMAVDGGGNLWVSYSTGKVIRLRPDGQVDLFGANEGLPTGSATCWLASGQDGILWFAKGREVGVFRDDHFQVLNSLDSAALRIAPSLSGGVWVCAGIQILKCDEGVEPVQLGMITSAESHDPSGLEPSVLLEDQDGAVWVGMISAGLYRCTSNSIARVRVSNPSILSLVQDHEGNIWVGTRGGGLDRVNRRFLSLIKSSDGLPFDAVQSVCQDASGGIWAVGDNGILAHRQNGTWIEPVPADGLSGAFVTCVAAGTNGAVWIGTRGGSLYRWTDGQYVGLGMRDRLLNKSVRSLLVTHGGDLWLSTDAPNLLYRLRGEELQSFDLPPGYRYLRAMAEDAAGDVWVGASDGLLVRMSGDRAVVETNISATSSIRCLQGTANGDLWIGYAGSGIARLHDGKISHFTTENGLPNDYVSQILDDGRGALWFAGNQGIFQVRNRDFEDVASGIATRVWPVVYGRSEGLRGLQASFDYCPSSLRGQGDRLYFSMLSGLAELRLDHVQMNLRHPRVLIERVLGEEKVFAAYQNFSVSTGTNTNQPLELWSPNERRVLRLPPGLQQLQFEFTALSFVAPDNVQFRYQLEGLDENWVEAGTKRIAGYTHPPPGTYRFKVIACNNDGVWVKNADLLTVIVTPFVWETIWFKLTVTACVFLALCGAVVVALRRRHRLVIERLEHQRAVEEERTRIARDLHDDLGVGLTEIGLLGDLACTGKEMPEPGRERVREITGRARELAASLDEIVWAINPANDVSQSLVDYLFSFSQKLLGRAEIRCRLEVVEPLPSGNLNAEKRHELFHAFKEALNNILRHSGATEVRVGLAAINGNLQISIADNGRGLGQPGHKGLHHGLHGMRERLLRLGGRCEIISGDDGGTTVIFVVPVETET